MTAVLIEAILSAKRTGTLVPVHEPWTPQSESNHSEVFVSPSPELCYGIALSMKIELGYLYSAYCFLGLLFKSIILDPPERVESPRGICFAITFAASWVAVSCLLFIS